MAHGCRKSIGLGGACVVVVSCRAAGAGGDTAGRSIVSQVRRRAPRRPLGYIRTLGCAGAGACAPAARYFVSRAARAAALVVARVLPKILTD